MKGLYELWATRGKSTRLLGSYSSLDKIKAAWPTALNEHYVLDAYVLTDKDKMNINDKMPPPPLREFRTAKERDQHVIDTAKYFTVIRFLGVGKYERHEVHTGKGDALSLGERLSKENKANYLVYAVGVNDFSALVGTIIYKR